MTNNNKKKVLIIDDNPDVLDAISLIMEDKNYEVETSLDGRMVLGKLASIPDVILLDKRLSGMDGLDVCRQLKARPATKDIPVIMISALPDIGKLAANAGADDFIEKPFNIQDLLDKVGKYVRP